jgi:hypothetical protein
MPSSGSPDVHFRVYNVKIVNEIDDGPKRSWWVSLPGILTGIGGLITAVTGLIVALSSAGILHYSTSTPSIAPPVQPLELSNHGSIASGVITAGNAATIDAVAPSAMPQETTVPRETTAPRETTLPFFMVRYVTGDDLRGKSPEELRLMRNEIYARLGRRFNDLKLQQYFAAQSWYVPRYPPDQFPARLLGPVQQANIGFIQKYEQQLK